MLPELMPLDEVQRRLLLIFPEGVPNRGFLVRRISASVVYTMLYIGAVEGNDIWLGPKHVYCMSDEQAALTTEDARLTYGQQAWKPKYVNLGQRWYADTTRESIRDETLREGLLQVDAAIQRKNLACLLPDVVLFDLHPQKELLVFIEIVASDGPVSVSRKAALMEMASEAGVPSAQIAFVTAYRDRNDAAFKKTFDVVAWNTLIWFMSEPNQIVILRDRPNATDKRIFDLLV